MVTVGYFDGDPEVFAVPDISYDIRHDILAVDRMELYFVILLGSERSRLAKDRVADLDLAHVVQGRGTNGQIRVFGRQSILEDAHPAQLIRQEGNVFRRVVDMRSGHLIAALDDGGKRKNDLLLNGMLFAAEREIGFLRLKYFLRLPVYNDRDMR